MKKALPILIMLCSSIFQSSEAQTGKVGIGTTSPLARLHVADSSVLFSASTALPGNPGLPPIQGAGRRMMWYPGAAAFRVGFVEGTQWDQGNTGPYSFASGVNTIASGVASTAMGSYAIASHNYSTSIGYATIASGELSLALGYQSNASGFASLSAGGSTTAKSSYETVLGRFNTDYVPAGVTGWFPTDRLFTIGNGVGIGSRSDALTVLKNGNIGIGVSTPTNKVHISMNSSGATPFSIFTPLVVENNDHTYINMLSPEISESGILFGKPSNAVSGAIVYNGGGTTNGLQFRVNGNINRMVITGNGNVGIGVLNPNVPLGFPAVLGKKITLYPGATGDVGMAVQGNLYQIYSDNPNADIAFGYDQGGTMIERMRVKGNGNVGIGTNNPQYPLDINGRMRLSGTNPNDPGIWLNDAGIDRAFVGLENNTYVGFYGNQGAGWKFGMNNQSGALKVNGSEGTAGQVLQSSGSGAAPNWSSVSSWLFNNAFQMTQTSAVIIPFGNALAIPGMHYADFSVVVNSTSKLILSLDAKIESIGCFACGGSSAFFQTYISRNGGGFSFINGYGDAGNAHFATITTGISVLTVPPGTYTFYSFGANHGGPDIRFTDTKLLIVVIPQ